MCFCLHREHNLPNNYQIEKHRKQFLEKNESPFLCPMQLIFVMLDILDVYLTLILLTWRIGWAHNASK